MKTQIFSLATSLGFATLTLSSGASAAPVGAAVGPESHLSAPKLSAPISAVEVNRSQALVTRRGRISIGAAGELVSLPDLPTSARDLRVNAVGAEVQRLTQRRVTRSAVNQEALQEAVSQLERLNYSAQLLQVQRDTLNRELGELRALSRELNGAGEEPLALNQKTLKLWDELSSMEGSIEAKISTELSALEERSMALKPKLIEALKQLDQLSQEMSSRSALEVLAYLKAKRPLEVQVELQYLVPNVSWSPAHELHVDTSTGRLKRSLVARVTQSSAEDWSGVKLSVSTADLSQSSSLPKLLTWTLSEQAQFLPQMRASRQPSRPPLFPAPKAMSPAPDPRQRALSALSQRMQQARSEASSYVSWSPSAQGAGAGRVGQAPPEPALYARESLSSDLSSAPPPPRPSRRARRSARSRPQRSAAPRPSPAPAMASTLAESEAMPSDDYSGASERPQAVSGRGLDDFTRYRASSSALSPRYEFSAPNPATVPSDGRPVTVPLSAQSVPIKLVYEATPALSPYAYLTGQVTHAERRPILAGPATMFSDGGYVGEAQLPKTLRGQEWTVPLGADPDIKLKRHIDVKTVVEGVISKDEISTYQVKIQVANYKRRAIDLKLYDALPVSQSDELEVTLLKSSPKAEIKEPKEGIVSWSLKLKPGERRELKLSYKVKRPKGWRVYQ